MSPSTVLAATIPIFLIIIAGGIARKVNWLPQATDAGVVNLVVKLLFPCLVIERIIGNPALDRPTDVLLAAGLGFITTAASVFASYLVAKLIGIKDGAGARTFGLCNGFQNYGYIAIPVTEVLFGRELIGVVFTFTLGVEFAMWTVGVGLLTGISKAPWKHALNAPVISILLALLLHYSGVGRVIPEVFHTFLGTLGACAIPVALLLIGASMADLIKLEHLDWKVASGSLLMRQLVLPLFLLAVAAFIPMSQELKQVICVQASMPAAMLSIVIARHYGGHPSTAVLVVLVTSITSLVTVPLIIGYGMKWLGL